MKKTPHLECSNCPNIKKGNSLFNQIENKNLKEVSDTKKCLFFKKGETVFYEGNMPTGIYCVFSGKIKLYRTGSEGKNQIIKIFQKGDVIGYRSILSDQRYILSASTIEDSFICFIPKETLYDLIKTNSNFSMGIIKKISCELGVTSKIITNMAQKSVRERLAELLLILKTQFGITQDNIIRVHLSREEIADTIGCSTETTIRLLSEFKKDKTIDLIGKKIKIIDLNNLFQIANISE